MSSSQEYTACMAKMAKRLGLSERAFKLFYDIGINNFVLVSARYLNTALTLDRSTLYHALKEVIKAHPALCVQLSGNGTGSPHFIRLPTIDLDDVVTFSPDTSDDYEAIFTKELANRSHGTTLWRLTVLKDNTVIFAFHHAIGDGRSGLAFHRSLLHALNAIPIGRPVDATAVVKTPLDIVLAEPAERILDVPVPFSTLFWMCLERRVLPRSWVAATSAWTGLPCSLEVHSRTHVRLHTITAPDAKLLLTLCRKNGCTLTGWLHTLAVYILSGIVHKLNAATMGDQRFTSLSVIMAFDIRPIVGCSEQTISTQSSTHAHHVPLLEASCAFPPTNASFPWTAARELSQSLTGYRAKWKESLGLLRFLYRRGDPARFMLRELGQKRDHSLALSNLGRFSVGPDDAGDKTAWSIGDAFFCAGNPTTGAAVTITAVGSPSGTINVVYSWGDDALEGGMGDAFVSGMKKGVHSLLHT